MASTICIFLHSFKGGGAERVAVTLANSLIEHGWHVQVVVQKENGPWRETLDPRTDVLELGGRFRELPFKLGRYLRRYQPDAVIAFITQFNIVAIIAAALSRWRGRLIVSERISLQAWTKWRPWWSSRIRWELMRTLYRRADLVVAVSKQLANDLVMKMNLPAEKVIAIPNPLSVKEIRKAALAPVSHRFFEEKLPVLIAGGRLTPQKDFPTLLRAVANLRERRDVRLIVLGEGPARSELEALVKVLGLLEVVDLPGFVSPPWPWMARANLFVLSSRAEGWPNVLAEALALGVPVVSTDCPTGPREILDNGRLGTLVPIGDVHAMSVAIEDMLDNPTDRAILRSRADDWSKELVIEAFLSILPEQGVV